MSRILTLDVADGMSDEGSFSFVGLYCDLARGLREVIFILWYNWCMLTKILFNRTLYERFQIKCLMFYVFAVSVLVNNILEKKRKN